MIRKIEKNLMPKEIACGKFFYAYKYSSVQLIGYKLICGVETGNVSRGFMWHEVISDIFIIEAPNVSWSVRHKFDKVPTIYSESGTNIRGKLLC